MIDLDELERLEREATEAREAQPYIKGWLEAEEKLVDALYYAARDLIADARRYRWLRDAPTADLIVVGDTGNVDVGMSSLVGTYESEFTGHELDTAIDAAIAKETP